MMKIGVQTKGILPEMKVDKGFEMIKAAGFDCVDINIDTFLKNTDVYSGKINQFFSIGTLTKFNNDTDTFFR